MRHLVLALLLLASRAAADPIQRSGPENFPAKNELSAHLGYQAGFGGAFANPSGFKLFFEYGRRLTDLVWFDVQLNQVFGAGASSGTCYDQFGRPFPCGFRYYYGGWATELAIGVKLKIKIQKIPLVVEVPIVGAIVGLYSRQCNDDGAALPVVRFGGGVKYFLTKRIGLGGGINFALGPGFHEAGLCQGSYTDFYGAFDFQLGAEFIL